MAAAVPEPVVFPALCPAPLREPRLQAASLPKLSGVASIFPRRGRLCRRYVDQCHSVGGSQIRGCKGAHLIERNRVDFSETAIYPVGIAVEGLSFRKPVSATAESTHRLKSVDELKAYR